MHSLNDLYGDIMALISVIVPVYNVESYLRQCIDSIIAQSFNDFELILVDDGSSDSSMSICNKYKSIDKRIIVLHQKNGGVSSARNTGIEYALSTDSEYISFVDSDDWLDVNFLSTLFKTINDYNCDVSLCKYYNTDKRNAKIVNKECGIEVVEKDFFWDKNIPVVIWNKLYKKNIFYDLRFPVGKLAEDEYVYHHILFKCQRIAICSNTLYYYFNRPGSISNNKDSKFYKDACGSFIDRFSLLFSKGMNKYGLLFFDSALDLYDISTIMYIKESTEIDGDMVCLKNEIYKYYCSYKKNVNFHFKTKIRFSIIQHLYWFYFWHMRKISKKYE